MTELFFFPDCRPEMENAGCCCELFLSCKHSWKGRGGSQSRWHLKAQLWSTGAESVRLSFYCSMDFSCSDSAACEQQYLMGMASFASDFASSSHPFGVPVNFIQSRTFPIFPRPCILDNLTDQPNSLCVIGKITEHLKKHMREVNKHFQCWMNIWNDKNYNKSC